MKKIDIWIPGEPSRTTHQSGIRTSARGGKPYKSSSLIGWEHTLARGLKEAVPEDPIEGPVFLKVTWGFKAKKAADLYTWKMTRPDTDNMQKTLKDVMSKIGFWKDDSQVVFEQCKKIWVDDPGIVIRVEELAGCITDWREL